jgi:hypothetical protein
MSIDPDLLPARQRVSIAEAAARLGTSIDTIRRRVKRRQLDAQRDNGGKWWVLLPADLPMQSAQPPTQHAAYEPMQHAAYAPMQHVTEIADLKVRLELVIAERDRLAAAIERGDCDRLRLAEIAEKRLEHVLAQHSAERDRLLGLLADRDRAIAGILDRVIALEEARAPHKGREPLASRTGLVWLWVLLAFAWWAAAGWHVHLIGKLDRLLALDPACTAPGSAMACGWHLARADPMAYVVQPLIAIGLPLAALGVWLLSTRMRESAQAPSGQLVASPSRSVAGGA